MKVHYKPKITDKIREEIVKAQATNREIDFIELTDGEMYQFKKELASYGPKKPRKISPFQTQIKYMGVEVVKEGFHDDEDGELC